MKKRKRKSNYWALRIKSVLSRVRICQGCGDGYVKKKHSGHKEGEKYCSRGCAYKNQDIWNKIDSSPKSCKLPEYSILKSNKCQQCDIEFIDKRKKMYCGLKCSMLAAGKKRQKETATTNCAICEALFSRLYGNKSTHCSNECRTESDKRQSRKSKAIRRAKSKGATIVPLDPFDAFDRDSWHCRACGCETPKSLRGTRHENAPELDHIIPLARDGEHTEQNTQCLCKTCNSLKGTMTMIEFMMSNDGCMTASKATAVELFKSTVGDTASIDWSSW